jgi:hypothetical protein
LLVDASIITHSQADTIKAALPTTNHDGLDGHHAPDKTSASSTESDNQ